MSSLFIHFFMLSSTTFTYMTSNNKNVAWKIKYFCISCSLRWFPTPITTEKRSAMWFMRDKMCWNSFSRLEVDIIRFYTLFCVYWYTIFVKIASICMLFVSLNFADMFEIGVACRPLCSAIGKMRFHKMTYILLFIKESWLLPYILLKPVTFCVF